MSTTEPAEPDAPVRVCRKCSTQAQASGDFCPHCGARYSKKRRSRKARFLIFGLPLLLLLAGGGIAAGLIIHHNNQVAAKKRAAAQAAARKAAAARAAKAAQQRLKRQQAKVTQALANAQRTILVSGLQNAVKKDAEKDVADGLLTGPIIKVQCQPATSADATASIANYTCIAAKSETGGTLDGYRFSASIDTQTGSYSWHLGG